MDADPAAAVVAVRALHDPRTLTNEHMAPYTVDVCVECRQVWPCKTEQEVRRFVPAEPEPAPF